MLDLALKTVQETFSCTSLFYPLVVSWSPSGFSEQDSLSIRIFRHVFDKFIAGKKKRIKAPAGFKNIGKCFKSFPLVILKGIQRPL